MFTHIYDNYFIFLYILLSHKFKMQYFVKIYQINKRAVIDLCRSPETSWQSNVEHNHLSDLSNGNK